ncbi:hypothetical protein HYV43_06645 [Candidatus Micrarchaeota archaeon]|nr:hypothetical protein [Candidatus Micrarchaeota archaeon]
MLNERFSAKAEAFLARKAGADRGKQLAASVMHPSRKTEIALAHDLLSRMKKSGFTDADLSAFHGKYAWLSCLDVFNEPWTFDDVRLAVQSAKAEKSEEKTLSFDAVLNGLDVSAAEEFILRAAHDLVFIKDQRDVYRRQGVFLSLPFFQTVAKMAGCRVSDVAYWTKAELLGFLDGGRPVRPAIARARKDGFLLFEKDGDYACLVGADAKKAQVALGIRPGSVESAVLVKGTVGSRGSGVGPTRGIAKIVRTVADLDKVKTGDVLVAITTHPDFVPAMHRACAIVTDEGGITSHAAIVSREFGIPCVVGTKVATSAFKDGDVLQVDAEKGMVKKIIRNHKENSGFETALASEKALAKTWLSKEEDEAWAHLQEAK